MTPDTDTAPGPYFVSAIDGPRTYLMAGPYETHADALANVDKALNIAYEHDARAWFMAWGTVRIPGSQKVGRLTALGLI